MQEAPDIVKELLIKYVPEDWVEHIDFSTLRKAPTENHGQELDESRDDVIWEVCFGESKLFVYILIEFQTKPQKYMAARMLSYIGNLYIDLIRSKVIDSSRALPPIFPLVVYNAKPAWNAALSMHEIVYCPFNSLRKYIPDFRYQVFDEHENLKKVTDPKTFIDILIKIECCSDRQEMQELMGRLVSIVGCSDASMQLLRGFVLLIKHALLRSGKTSQEVLNANWDEISHPEEVGNMLEATAKKWYKQILSEGEAKGEARGEAKGMGVGVAVTINTILGARFGNVPSELFAQIEAVKDLEVLKELSIKSATAESLENFTEHLHRLAASLDENPASDADKNRVSEPVAEYCAVNKKTARSTKKR